VPAAKVLVIDDDFDFVEYARIVLESAGYQVFTAESVDLGLALMRQKRPDVVVLDAVISYDLSGLSVTKEIRNDPDLAKIPLILVSAIVSDEELAILPEHEGVAFDLFMSKPIEPGELLQRVQQLTVRRPATTAPLTQSTPTQTSPLDESASTPTEGDANGG
jgi:CheY-like chemotaxis protein